MVTTTNYIYDGYQYLGETDENNAVTKRYVNKPDTYTHLIAQHEVASGENRYYHYDAIGSTREVTDDTETVTDEFTYDAWGNRLSRSGTSDIPFQYVGAFGYYLDTETGSDYILARVYQPMTARWWSADPIGILGGLNSYLYANNSPVFFIDAQGLFAEEQNGISEIEKQLLKLHKCKCKLFGKDLAEGTTGSVICKDGKLTVGGGSQDEATQEVIAIHKKCKLYNCTEEEEKHHILQAKLLCPNICYDECQPSKNDRRVGLEGKICENTAECCPRTRHAACLANKVCEMEEKGKTIKDQCYKAGILALREIWPLILSEDILNGGLACNKKLVHYCLGRGDDDKATKTYNTIMNILSTNSCK